MLELFYIASSRSFGESEIIQLAQLYPPIASIAQVVQAMVREAGFDVKIQSTEFATSLDMADKGQFEAYVLAWSGRADPDGNIFSVVTPPNTATRQSVGASARSTA